MAGLGRLYGGDCVVLLRMVPKVLRSIVEIRCVVGF